MEYALEGTAFCRHALWCVLILVLMEYALEEANELPWKRMPGVLILVLMEYALEARVWETSKESARNVLILVLMEYALEGACGSLQVALSSS